MPKKEEKALKNIQMKAVSPKKKLGQHFLNDLNIAQKITDLLQHQNCDIHLHAAP